MVQVKIYGRREVWSDRKQELSDVVHRCVVAVWKIPEDKRFHRILLAEPGELIAPTRSDSYLIVEIVCFAGRSVDAKRELVRAMYDDVAPALGLRADDLEVVILEAPRENWGIRGFVGDELTLGYRVDL
ncbi:Phenylpyruvate tautomerase PptA, 4-oxalocrotonate tautomerase family [Paraoerskovia marina]|uniref:Phenylpyruvate tautomerase PptA, 4-oxalocrotonate tautomerase family n=1 Tax=Paraoerskovia marina TaxID=545619 RepID=A0A1H1S3Z4_9CELL|nr:tautomerase family protein [Paraoerskovia marina]SDS41949.1 Phenylpyruvate tautomerase PptA, 4-oxalocrotonate tautomerase family [Paraoerskovia marina]